MSFLRLRMPLIEKAASRRISSRQLVRNNLTVGLDSGTELDDKIAHSTPKSAAEILFITSSLSSSVFLTFFDESELHLLATAMEKHNAAVNEKIIAQGDKGQCLYVVEDGKVEVSINRKVVRCLSRGEYFGELSMFYGAPCSATCRALEKTLLWKIERRTLQHILAMKSIREKEAIVAVLRQVSILNHFSPRTLLKMASVFHVKSCNGGDVVLAKGDTSKYFHVIKEGSVKMHDEGEGDCLFEDKILTVGDYFGGVAISTDRPNQYTITAITDCSFLCMRKQHFVKLVEKQESIAKRGIRRQVLTSAPVFARSNLKSVEIDALVDLFEEKTFEAGTILFKMGDMIKNPGFMIIDSGSLQRLESDGTIANLVAGNHFGGQTLTYRDEFKSQRTIQFLERTTLAILTRANIQSIIFDVSRLGKVRSFVPRLTAPITSLDDLDTFRILGKEQWGILRLAAHKQNNSLRNPNSNNVTHTHITRPYALKIVSKRQILEEDKVEQIFREKNILASFKDSTFVVNLVSTFQDRDNLYLLFDFIHGGELFRIVHSDSRGRNVEEALFYMACIILSFNQLYNRHICHRDLRTENVLIDRKGYCILTDFGSAKIVIEGSKTYTFCGTPEYLAPEVILCKGHDCGADHWSVGIFLYELLTSVTPFYSSGIDNVKLFKRIVKVKYTFPDCGRFTEDSKDLIRNLLLKNTTQRLGGMEAGFQDISNHAFFKTIDWKKLYLRKLKAPWRPNIKGDLDPSNYEIYPEDEIQRESLGGNDLTNEEQSLFEGF